MEHEKKKPWQKVKVGKISVSLWRTKYLRRGDPRATGYVEQYLELERACVQHSRKSRANGEWENQQIWMHRDELCDLANALEKLKEEGDDSPDSSASTNSEKQGSIRAHRVVEYIKVNSLDIGLDVYDLQEATVNEVLSEIGIQTELTPSEKTMIVNDLKDIVEKQEFAEIAFQIQSEPIFSIIPGAKCVV